MTNRTRQTVIKHILTNSHDTVVGTNIAIKVCDFNFTSPFIRSTITLRLSPVILRFEQSLGVRFHGSIRAVRSAPITVIRRVPLVAYRPIKRDSPISTSGQNSVRYRLDCCVLVNFAS